MYQLFEDDVSENMFRNREAIKFMLRFIIRISLLFSLELFSAPVTFCQVPEINHWETVIKSGDIWYYLPGVSEPPGNWKELRKGALSTDTVMAYTDNTIDYLGESMESNFARLPVPGNYIWPNYFIGSTYEEEVTYLKDRINARMAWIDDNMAFAGDKVNNRNNTEKLLYPNPATSKINLSFYLSSDFKPVVEIFDLDGKLVYSVKLSPGTSGYLSENPDVSHLATGYYILRITQDGTVKGHTKLIIKSR
jgi:Secretion system C-terminal sorting domain